MKEALTSGGMGAVADIGAGGAAKLGGMMSKGFGFGGKALGSFFWREQGKTTYSTLLRLIFVFLFSVAFCHHRFLAFFLDLRRTSAFCCEGQYFLDVYSQPFHPPPLYSSDYHSFVCWLVLKYIIVIPFKLTTLKFAVLSADFFLLPWHLKRLQVLKNHCSSKLTSLSFTISLTNLFNTKIIKKKNH